MTHPLILLLTLAATGAALSGCATSASGSCTRDPVTGTLKCCIDYVPETPPAPQPPPATDGDD